MKFSVPPFLSRRSKQPDQPSLSDQLETLMFRARRVMLLDDNHLLLELLTIAAEKYDVEIVPVSTIAEATEHLKSDERFDLAVLDITLMNGSGVDLYRWVMKNKPALPVAFFTGTADTRIEREIHSIGSAPIYYKPSILTRSFLDDLFSKLGARRRTPC